MILCFVDDIVLIVNLFNIKNTNGLFYYGVDFAKEAVGNVRRVLVRPQLKTATEKAFPNAQVISCGFDRFVWEIMQAWLRGWFIYTPSSHPLPFIRRQMVVLHDTYPFMGRAGKIKEALFVLAAKTSRCLLAYINHADGLAFYRQQGFAAQRLVFAPNRFPGPCAAYGEKRNQAESRLIVGLVGTDSPKKNYAQLFAALRECHGLQAVLFLIYGHETAYLAGVRDEFPDAGIDLVKSDAVTMPDFLASIDVLVSAAKNEGFGRPIASALQSGIPCFLLDNPVFREFFDGGANFYPELSGLVDALLDARASGALHAIEFQPPTPVVDAFSQATQKLRSLDTY